MAICWHRWSIVSLLSICLYCLTANADSPSFENTAIVRTIELDGALTHITSRYSVRALRDGASEYIFALGKKDGELTTWVDATIKGEDELAVTQKGLDADGRTLYYSVTLPSSLKYNTNVSLVFNTIQSNAAYPYPAAVPQEEPQSLKYGTDLFVISPYPTVVQRTKIRAPTPHVHNYTIPSKLSKFTEEERSASKSSATITYGPYNNIPISTTADFITTAQQRLSVHYEIEDPVLRVPSLRRVAEVSHWGANLNIQDSIHLKNDGAILKGHFARITHQVQTFHQRPLFGSLRSITLHLPPGISSPYYFDLVGNVSTSKFRPSFPKRAQSEQWSVLELRPRYPLLGGWNYSFTLGWDAPLGDSAKYDAKNGRYILGVPFWTPIAGASVDDAEVMVVLPEGATDIEIHEPFLMRSIKQSTHVTYLDTIGRPCVTFIKDRLTDRHTGRIYVSYKVPFSAHLKKPIAVGTATLGLFLLAMLARRIDPRLQKNAK